MKAGSFGNHRYADPGFGARSNARTGPGWSNRRRSPKNHPGTVQAIVGPAATLAPFAVTIWGRGNGHRFTAVNLDTKQMPCRA